MRILNDGARFLSSEIISALEKSDVEVWGIYLNRVGSYFTSLFHKLQGLLDMNVVDLPICIDACGNDMYIHIMVREEQLDVAKRIKQDVLDGFSK